MLPSLPCSVLLTVSFYIPQVQNPSPISRVTSGHGGCGWTPTSTRETWRLSYRALRCVNPWHGGLPWQSLLQDVYDTFNAFMRRKPKENNFKVSHVTLLLSLSTFEHHLSNILHVCNHVYYHIWLKCQSHIAQLLFSVLICGGEHHK